MELSVRASDLFTAVTLARAALDAYGGAVTRVCVSKQVGGAWPVTFSLAGPEAQATYDKILYWLVPKAPGDTT